MVDKFECPTCGFEWSKGQHGGHDCAKRLKYKIEQLEAENKALKVDLDLCMEFIDNSGVDYIRDHRGLRRTP